ALGEWISVAPAPDPKEVSSLQRDRSRRKRGHSGSGIAGQSSAAHGRATRRKVCPIARHDCHPHAAHLRGCQDSWACRQYSTEARRSSRQRISSLGQPLRNDPRRARRVVAAGGGWRRNTSFGLKTILGIVRAFGSRLSENYNPKLPYVPVTSQT